ncbi:hypothetical protein IWX79_002219 [Janthinobacterium sp. CAN_S1]|uniref:hypothetical protein n=1 Tax=Janthinobacterium sp. CAN_S7 TaxID=3071704 RepID=UPI001A1EA5D0
MSVSLFLSIAVMTARKEVQRTKKARPFSMIVQQNRGSATPFTKACAGWNWLQLAVIGCN